MTLATWRVSRRPATNTFPWGYSKVSCSGAPIYHANMQFETLGTLSVSVILVGGAIGIGLHSYHVCL